MRVLGIILVTLILLIQVPLWGGKGGWLGAWETEAKLAAQRARNAQIEQRNALLSAEVVDLKQGHEAIEERARYELGMIRQGEVFFQIVEEPARRK